MTTNVTGTDGVVPVENPDGLWTTWSLQQLFTGGPGAGRYVGKVWDYVVDPTTDERWVITAVDPTTLVPTLKSIVPVINPGDIDTTDLLYGVGPGTDSDTYRCYIDKSVLPYKLVVDQRLYINSVLTKYVKIFQGSKLNGTDKVISAFYDASGNFLGDNVPLELAAMPNGQNYAVKSVQPCYTKAELADGDKVTVVAYADDGGVVSTRQLLVQNTAFIRSTDASLKYVTAITLESPFISDADPNTLQYPLNVPLSGFNLFGVVHYSDGSKLRMPVDGTKFKVMGFEHYVATVVGQKFTFTLKYTLSPNEIVYSAQTGTPDGERFKTETYTAITQNQDGAYTVKLFAAPVFDTVANQYRLDWYLYNLDRNVAINVTPYVRYATNTPGFQPAAYGINQQLQVNLNLNDVNGAYKKWVFTQTLGIVLYRQATDQTGDPWAIWYDPAQEPPYGKDLHAKVQFVNQNLKYVDISLGLTDQAAWLAKILPASRPLFDPASEPTYPAPNMFSFVMSDGTEVEFPLTQWQQQNIVSGNVPNAGTLYVKFFQRTPENDIQIALCPMVLWQIN